MPSKSLREAEHPTDLFPLSSALETGGHVTGRQLCQCKEAGGGKVKAAALIWTLTKDQKYRFAFI